MTRDFFAATVRGTTRDAASGRLSISGLEPAYDEDGLWVGLAVLHNRDAEGREVGVEHNAYQLVRTADGWRIAVTTPLDAA